MQFKSLDFWQFFSKRQSNDSQTRVDKQIFKGDFGPFLVHIAKTKGHCAQIVKISSVKFSEIVKTIMKQLWNDQVSCQNFIYKVNHVFYHNLQYKCIKFQRIVPPDLVFRTCKSDLD